LAPDLDLSDVEWHFRCSSPFSCLLFTFPQEELEALKARLEKAERERAEFKQTSEVLEGRVSTHTHTHEYREQTDE